MTEARQLRQTPCHESRDQRVAGCRGEERDTVAYSREERDALRITHTQRVIRNLSGWMPLISGPEC